MEGFIKNNRRQVSSNSFIRPILFWILTLHDVQCVLSMRNYKVVFKHD